MTESSPTVKDEPTPQKPSAAWKLVQQAIDKLKYGAIQLTIHEGKLVQVDVTERNRFPN